MATSPTWRELHTRAEFERIAALEREVYPAEDCITADEYLEYKAAGNRVWLLFLGDDWIANYQLNAIPPDAPVQGAGSYISGLAVFKRFAGQGYARLAMDRIMTDHAHEPMTARIRLDNRAPQSLVARYGFEPAGEQVRDGVIWQWYVRASTREPQLDKKD